MALSTLAFAACENKSVNQPVITPPGTISVTPVGPITLAVGQATTLSANTGNLTAVTFTCTTNTTPANAVVEVSGTNPCTVTAKAAGSATVTLKAVGTNGENGSQTVQQSVQIIVTGTSGPPVTGSPTVTIQSITNQAGGNVDVTNAAGQINIAMNVDIPAGVQASKIRVLVDGTTACEQTITGATTGAISVDGAEIPVTVVCSIPTNALGGSITCPNTATNSVCFFNGSHVIKAQIIFTDATGDHIIASAADFPIVLNNTNFIAAQVTYSGVNGGASCTNSTAASGLAPAGALWCAGSVTVKLTPAIYTAGGNTGVNGLQSANVTITTSGLGSNGLGACNASQTAAAGINSATNTSVAAADRVGAVAGSPITPNCGIATASQNATIATDGTFTATFPYTASMSAGGVANVEDNVFFGVTSLTNAGQVGPICINPNPSTNPQNGGVVGGGFVTCGNGFLAAGAPVQRLDNLAPRVVNFDVTVPTIACVGATIPTGCYVSNPAQITNGFKMVDYGVDTPTAAFSFGTTGTNAALPGSFTLADQTTTSTTNFASVVVVDKLGNTSAPRFASNTATTTLPSATAATGVPGLNAQKFGIDIEAPVCAFSGGVAANSINNNPATGTFSVSRNDIATPPAGPSGFSPNPVLTSVTLLTPAGTSCVIGTGTGCAQRPGTGNDVFNAGAQEGYFMATESVVDQAGNVCGPITRTVLYDVTAPVVGSIGEPSVIQAGNNTVSFSGDLHDNIDLGILNATLRYGAVIPQLQKQINVTLSTFGPPLVTDVTGVYTDPAFIRSVETTTGGGAPSGAVTNADQVTFRVTDVAGNLTTRNEDITASVNAGGSFGSFAANNPALQTWTTAITNGATFCNGVGTCVNPSTASVRSQVTGPALTFPVPFARVEWYATNPGGVAVKFAEQAGNTAVGNDNTIINIRTWTYNTTWTMTGLAAGAYNVFAIGIDQNGRGLMSNSVPVTVSNT